MADQRTEEKIYLRPITKKDTDLVVSWRNNQRIQNNFIFQGPFTREIHNHWLDTEVADGRVVQFIIIEKLGQHPIGSVYLRDIDYEKKCAEYGIFIGEDVAVGKGYGTQATKKVIAYAFETLGLKRIYLKVFADNLNAIQSYKDVGFKVTNYKKDAIEKNGVFRDLIFMELKNSNCEITHPFTTF